eukprot:gb/GECG01014037.1/.p1 GENE.gb/GECG01014037.1/~~gb/GECG01014037.1/.p1  ORF type:complete len:180 (+),score=19.06 gb/GECG01014037.1/:1-540(+)
MAASSARRREKDVMALLMSNYDVDLGNAGGDFGVSQTGNGTQVNGSGGSNASSSNSSATNGSGGTGQGHQSSSSSGGGVNASGLIEEFTVKFKGPEDSTSEYNNPLTWNITWMLLIELCYKQHLMKVDCGTLVLDFRNSIRSSPLRLAFAIGCSIRMWMKAVAVCAWMLSVKRGRRCMI